MFVLHTHTLPCGILFPCALWQNYKERVWTVWTWPLIHFRLSCDCLNCGVNTFICFDQRRNCYCPVFNVDAKRLNQPQLCRSKVIRHSDTDCCMCKSDKRGKLIKINLKGSWVNIVMEALSYMVHSFCFYVSCDFSSSMLYWCQSGGVLFHHLGEIPQQLWDWNFKSWICHKHSLSPED